LAIFRPFFLPLMILCCLPAGVQAAYIQRTISIDGDMSDWYDASNSYTPPGDITNNPSQYSTDAQTGAGDADTVGSTGRDLKKFSFTWDNTYLYFYVERWASSTNVTDWWFYLDTNADGLLESGEKVFRVNWQGANQKTDTEIWDYVASTSGGDPLTNAGVGDGYTMPGSITNSVSLYSNVVAGASSGTEMESRVSWADLGFSAPTNVKFHISSSNGTNLPNNILDNMDGPAGGSLFPKDLQVSKTASVSSVLGNQPFTYTIQVYNAAIIDFTNVVISDVLPSQVTYVSHTAEAGTTFVDSGSDGIPDQWNIPTIPANTTYTLTINVKGGVVPVTMTATNTATLTASDQTDENSSNDSASVDVDIQPVPVLTMVKAASSATVNPGANIGYSIVITNTGGNSAYNVIVNDALSPFSMLGIDTYGASIPFQLTDGSPASGVTLGTITYSNDNGATYTYVPVSGGGGAPAGYDANITNWKIQMSGTMNPSGSNFTIQYQAKIH
jgi:uncharacterized repeat protein (TIGR01451 family)